LLFRRFVGLSLDEAVWDATVFTKNRERLIEGDIARRFMAAVLNQGPVKALLSHDHFSVDGTLIEAWASMKSFRPQGRQRRATGAGPQRRAGLSRRKAKQRDACLDQRPGCSTVPQGIGPAGQAGLPGARSD
jgi:hypothetical protein